MYSLYKGGGGRGSGGPPPENFGKSRMQEKPPTTFLGLFFIFLFFINQFSLFFFCYSLKFSCYSLYFKPSLFSNQYFFAYYSLISIENGHYSLISKPHPDPHYYQVCSNDDPRLTFDLSAQRSA